MAISRLKHIMNTIKEMDADLYKCKTDSEFKKSMEVTNMFLLRETAIKSAVICDFCVAFAKDMSDKEETEIQFDFGDNTEERGRNDS